MYGMSCTPEKWFRIVENCRLQCVHVESLFGQACWKVKTPQMCQPIKTLHLTKETFQNKNTSVQSCLGEHGPLRFHTLIWISGDWQIRSKIWSPFRYRECWQPLRNFHPRDKATYSWFATTWQGGHVGDQTVNFFLKKLTWLLWCQLQTSNLNIVNTRLCTRSCLPPETLHNLCF